ncbi:MAG: type II restriction endonuclease [Candidatus Pacearchaeota archaeon]
MYNFDFGSRVARGGFANERAVCEKFNKWKMDEEAKIWLSIMGYKIKDIQNVKAIQIPARIKRTQVKEFGFNENEYEALMKFKKADIQVQIRILIKINDMLKIENLSLKKANSDADYNQVDKRWVDSYREMWNFDDEIAIGLKLFTGEIPPAKYPGKLKVNIQNLRDKKRVFLDELNDILRDKIVDFFKRNKILIVSDILKGRGGFSADWMLVTKYDKSKDTTAWVLKDINTVMNFFGQGDVKISPQGNLYIGRITMQRKGGTPDPTKLQFKIKPCDLFNIDKGV